MSKKGRRTYEQKLKYWTAVLGREILFAFVAERREAYRQLRSGTVDQLAINRSAFFTGREIKRLFVPAVAKAMKEEADSWRLMMSKRESKNFDVIDFINNYILTYFLVTVVRAIIERRRERWFLFIQQAQDENWGKERTLRELQRFGIDDRLRANTIARVEAARAINAAQAMSATQFPYRMKKQWVTVGDNRVRGLERGDKADHWALDGIEIPEDQLFRDPVSGSLLAYPMDMTNGAKLQDVINCRCHVEYTIEYDAFGKPIPK